MRSTNTGAIAGRTYNCTLFFHQVVASLLFALVGFFMHIEKLKMNGRYYLRLVQSKRGDDANRNRVSRKQLVTNFFFETENPDGDILDEAGGRY